MTNSYSAKTIVWGRAAPLCASGLLLLGSSAPAYAYLDGGTASLLIQALVGGLAAAGVVLVSIRQKIMSFFGKAPKHTSDPASPAGSKVEPSE